LPAAIDAVVARALAGETSLVALAAQLQAFLGIAPRRLRVRRWLAGMAATFALVVALVSTLHRAPGGPRLDPDTGLDPEVVDSLWECSFGLAWMDEQTAAAVFADSLVRLEGQRVGYDSPRVWWTTAWVSWLKQQANDYLTAEQTGEAAAARLAALLGPDHPHSTSAAIVHASTMQQRGAWEAAAALASSAWSSHIRRIGLPQATDLGHLATDSRFRRARLDRDGDGDGLADLAEEFLGTPPATPATPIDMFAGRPARSLALPLSPGFLIAHVQGTPPWLEGFGARATVAGALTPLHTLSSVQRGFAERYGWSLMVAAGAGTCSIELDTGRTARRLRVAITGERGQWLLSTAGAAARAAAAAEPMWLAGDYDAATRTVYWWTSVGRSWTTSFDQLPPSGPGPYGLRLSSSHASDGCRSVTWTLRGAAVAPM
jgi:hypothetical protein